MFKLVTDGVTVDMERKKREAFQSLSTCSVGTQLWQVEGQGRLVTLLGVKQPAQPKAAPPNSKRDAGQQAAQA